MKKGSGTLQPPKSAGSTGAPRSPSSPGRVAKGKTTTVVKKAPPASVAKATEASPPPAAAAAAPTAPPANAAPVPPVNPLLGMQPTASDMAMPDFTTEATRRTETASSAMDLRTDTQSAPIEPEEPSVASSASLNFEEAEAEPQEKPEPQQQQEQPPPPPPAAAAAKPEPAPAAAVKKSPSLQKDASVTKEKKTVNEAKETKEAKEAKPQAKEAKAAKEEKPAKQTKQTKKTANNDSADKNKLYSDADSSYSENVSPRTIPDNSTTVSSLAPSSPAKAVVPPPKKVVATPAPQPTPQQTSAMRHAQEFRVGDHPPVIVKGVKYVFDNRDMRWKTHDVTVRILHPNRGVDQDNYFAIFAAELLDPIKAAAPMFAKVYRRNIADVSEADYYSIGQAQALCEEFARDYSRQEPRAGYPRYRLPLLTNRVVVRINLKSILDPNIRNARKGFFSYRTEDTHQLMFFMEPNTLACAAVGASFTSAEVDDGKCYPHGDPAWPKTVYSDIADGLSHFSFVQSREKMLVHGFLRSNGYLLDPLFHTTDREGFRMGDGGKKGIEEWIKQHRCGDTCRALGLRYDPRDAVDVSAAAAFNPLVSQDNHYTDYLRCVRQMRVVVRIALESQTFTDNDDDEVDAFDDVSSLSESLASAQQVIHAVPVAPITFPLTVNAFKYVFLPARSRWEEVPTRMTVVTPNKPIMTDDRHATFSIQEIHEGSRPIPMRAKFILRDGAKDADYYHVGDAYCVCVALGQVFRGYREKGVFDRELDFRSAYAVRVPQSEIPESVKAHMSESNFFAHTTADSGDVMFVLEPEFTSDAPQHAAGAKRMPKDAEGFDDPDLRQMVDAFSHFTLQKSGNHMLVCNLKCKDGLLIRPHINTSNARGFETLNGGERGIRHWMRHHTCNAICRGIGLEPLPPKLKLYDISTSKLMIYINRVQQHALGENEKVDFNLPSRPQSEMINRQSRQQSVTSLTAPADDRRLSLDSAAASNGASASVSNVATSPAKDDGEPLLRPWVHTGKGAIPNYPPKRNGVLASGPRRPLTQAELTRLESKGIDTKFVLPATKYTYDINTLSWRMQRIFVRVAAPERGIGQGGMRVCFEVTDLDVEDGAETVMVAKMYRRTIKDVVEKDYFTEVAVQQLCSLFAKDFNAEKKEGCDVRLTVLEGAVIAIERQDLNPELMAKKTGFFSYRTTDSQRLMFSVEPRLVGRFTKYNGNMGEAYPTNESRLSPAMARERTKVFEAAEALSHYSLMKSEGGLLVCDMQGVGNELTDLEVHTYDGKGLGIGNFGARGIQKFVERHRCTSVCKALNLPLLREQKFEVTEEVKKNNRFVGIFERSKEIDQV